jgi:uncharacterized protein YqeY
MKYVKGFNQYNDSQMVNEEFVGPLVKGALSKLFQVFSAPFKDLVNDIKKAFKEDDPNSIKQIVLTNLNQAIDGAQTSMKDKNLQEGDILNIMTQFITNLTNLANGIGKDFNTAINNKSKASAANEIAKAILIGSKEAQWKGILGLLNDPNYKFSKVKYESALVEASKKQGADTLKAKQDTAIRFFDGFQKDITTQIDKELTEEEMQKIYDDAIKKGGGQVSDMNYEKLKEFFDKKTSVRYKREGYDDNKKPEEQADKIGTKVIDSLDDQGNVGFKEQDGTPFKKKYADILGPSEETSEAEAEDLKTELSKIKTDKEKLKSVKNFTQFLQTAPKDKLAEVEELIKPK